MVYVLRYDYPSNFHHVLFLLGTPDILQELKMNRLTQEECQSRTAAISDGQICAESANPATSYPWRVCISVV